MREGKAFASLSSGLLARKGQARPAMRPQGFGFHQGTAEDLGWNDMGHDVPRPMGVRLPADLAGAPPAPPPAVHRQQEEIAREFGASACEAPAAAVEGPRPRQEPKSKPARKAAKVVASYVAAKVRKPRAEGRKAAFTLRLDGERHLRLRLACAVQNRSAQQLVTDALDRLLDGLPDVDRLVASLPRQDGTQETSR